MTPIYTPDKCLQKLDTVYRMQYHVALTDCQHSTGCVDCTGRDKTRGCYVNLELLMRKLEDMGRIWE